MTDPLASGVQQAPRSKASLYDVAIRVVFPIILAVGTGATTLLWAHEGRLTVIEIRSEGIKEDLAEIKADVKKLLGGNR